MAFEGDLTNLGLADIFQTLGMNRQSGTLVVKMGETERRFYFSDDGVSLLTTRSARKFRLGNLLVGMGKLSEGDSKVAVLKQERAKETKLGDILIQTGLVKDEDIKDVCKYQSAEEIYDSFNWKSGKFQFLEGANAGPAGGPGPFAEFFFQVTDIVMEAARRSDEFAMNLTKIGDLDQFYIRSAPVSPPESEVGRAGYLLHGMLDGTMDVKQVFEEFFLSPFDTSAAFVVLVDRNLIHTMAAPDLLAAAGPFLAAKDYPRASRLLGRAARLDPTNPELLSSLADTQSAAGDRKEAGKTYTALGELLKDKEPRTPAVEALRKAIEHDTRNERAYELVMEVYAALDQFDRAEEACREAARLLSDDRDFNAALRLLDRGLGFLPESVDLRLQRANCQLALGQKTEGLQEMNAVAADLERLGDPRRTLSVYNKLKQLDPENALYKEKVDHLVTGEKARETRKKLLKVAAGVGVAGLLVAAWFLKPATQAEKLEMAEVSVRSGDAAARAEAEVLLRAIAASAEKGSEEEMTAGRLIAELEKINAAPERKRRVKELEDRLASTILEPAEALMKERKYPEGAAKILEVSAVLKDKEINAYGGEELLGMWKRVQERYRKALTVPADALREEAKTVKSALSEVGSVDLLKADAERQRQVYETAGKAIQARDRADWKATVDALTTAAKSLPAVDTLRVADLALTLEQMQMGIVSLEDTWHRAHAEVAQREFRSLFFETEKVVAKAKGDGNLGAGVEACDRFLAACGELRKEVTRFGAVSAKYFGPVVEKVFDLLKWDVAVKTTRESLLKTADGLAKAKAAEQRATAAYAAGQARQGDKEIQTAFEILKATIAGAQDVGFQGLARLPLRVVTRPPGADLTLLDAAGVTVAKVKTPCLIHYPYQGKTVLRMEAAGFDTSSIERQGIDGDRDAVLNVDLQRTMRWRRNVGGAVEGSPGLAPGLVLVGTRRGLLSALSLDTGDEVFQVDTGGLSGISGGILVSGDRAWFGGMDGDAYCVDLGKRALSWKKPAGGPVERSPVLSGSSAVFPVASGSLHAFRAADGGEAWRKDLGAPLSGGILAAGDVVIATVTDGRVVALKGSDGSEKWTVTLPAPVYGTPTDDGRGGILVGTEGSAVLRLSLADGSTTWTAAVDAPVHARPVVRGASIVAVTTKGTVVRLAAANGREEAKTSLGTTAEGDVTEFGGVLYISASAGSLFAFGLDAHEVLWKRSGMGQLMASPAVTGEILIVASADPSGLVFALKP